MDLLLLCTDLDRTLLPNGNDVESPMAQDRFARLAARPEVVLAYVTGRHRESVEVAMAEYGLPTPRFAICDVGSSIYEIVGSELASTTRSAAEAKEWKPCRQWQGQLSEAWKADTISTARAALSELSGLSLQEPERQAPFKLSYYAPDLADPGALVAEVKECLKRVGAEAETYYSVDEIQGIGLLDLLPPGSGKRGAIEHLLTRDEFARERTLFAGDSGNDMEVLVSSIPAVLVANATERVCEQARRVSAELDHADRLFVARGEFLGMNGKYAAGILEGLAHYWPETVAWMA